jgi:hypothetical protein
MQTSSPPTGQPRRKALRVSMTDAEYERLGRMAYDQHKSMAAVIRESIFSSKRTRTSRSTHEN